METTLSLVAAAANYLAVMINIHAIVLGDRFPTDHQPTHSLSQTNWRQTSVPAYVSHQS